MAKGRSGGSTGGGAVARPSETSGIEDRLANTSEALAASRADSSGGIMGQVLSARNRYDRTMNDIRVAEAAGNTAALPGLRKRLRDEATIDNRAVYLRQQGIPVASSIGIMAGTRLTAARPEARAAFSRELRDRYSVKQLQAARSILAWRANTISRPEVKRQVQSLATVVDRAIRESR